MTPSAESHRDGYANARNALSVFTPEFSAWIAEGFSVPPPACVKAAVLRRHSLENATWVETGTFRGDTTASLITHAQQVFTIEPDPALYEAAVQRFRSTPSITVLNGLSEDLLPDILRSLTGNVCFWLDGHYSGQGTHMGPHDTPVVAELASITNSLSRFDRVTIAIDDIRLFNGAVHMYGRYPQVTDLIAWAVANGFSWHIEHDIFLAYR